MTEAIMGFSMYKHTPLHLANVEAISSPKTLTQLQKYPSWNRSLSQSRERRRSDWKVNAVPDWPLMAVTVEHVAGSKDWIVHKSVWHLSDAAMKNVYTMYIMFTCWGCCFFGSMKDPFYDGEAYRKDGGDGTSHWYYEKQEDIEAAAREELWKEELIEEIEQKVGGLRELEDADREEELVK